MKGLLLVHVSCESALNGYQSIPTVDEKDELDLKKKQTNKKIKSVSAREVKTSDVWYYC